MMFRDPLQLFGFAPNGVTVLCPGVAVGDSFTLGGVTYTKRDRAGLLALVGSANEADLVTSCTTGVTDMSSMFFVRVPSSRVLLLLSRRRVFVVTRHPSPRSEIAAHSARPPVPGCAVGSHCLQPGHRWMGRELGDEHAGHVLCTCSSIPRVAALASPCLRRLPSPIPSLRDRRSLRAAARPSLRCRMPKPSIRTSVNGT